MRTGVQIPRAFIKPYTCNSHAPMERWAVETEFLGAQRPAILEYTAGNSKPAASNKVEDEDGDLRLSSDLYTCDSAHIYIHTHVCMCVQVCTCARTHTQKGKQNI